MNESRKKSFLDAVDTVCGECIDLSEETCDGCPVRRTVESIDIDPIYGRPMTAEQLRNMDGQPVKVKDLAYVTHENLPTGVVTMNDPNDSDNGVYVGYSLHCIKDYGKGWIAYEYHPAHIDREAWNTCGYCNGAKWAYGNITVCVPNGDKKQIETEEERYFDYCPICGRPLTEEAWAELEKRLRG